MRSAGPGGQHVNRTASAVRLTHLPTGVVVQCQDHRERLRNRVDAIRHLRLALALAIRGVGDPQWLAPYRSGRHLRAGANAQDYHLLVGCTLDALARCAGRLAEAAADVQLSTSQLVKLWCADKAVRTAANAIRQAHGHGPVQAR